MSDSDAQRPSATADGAPLTPPRSADHQAIADLAISYAHAVDDQDWARWEGLFVPDALIDYRSSGGITGTPAEIAAWMPDAMSAFTWSMHSISTPEIRFVDDDHATGRVHLHNRNGVEWEGEPEILDVMGFYHDSYVRRDGAWRFASRVEKTLAFDGGRFADLVREAAASTQPDDGS
jgi:hypothetical protein